MSKKIIFLAILLKIVKCGYKVLRFWESDIKREEKNQSDYIRTTIQQVTG